MVGNENGHLWIFERDVRGFLRLAIDEEQVCLARERHGKLVHDPTRNARIPVLGFLAEQRFLHGGDGVGK